MALTVNQWLGGSIPSYGASFSVCGSKVDHSFWGRDDAGSSPATPTSFMGTAEDSGLSLQDN